MLRFDMASIEHVLKDYAMGVKHSEIPVVLVSLGVA